jgi:hypothetical protein
VAAGELEEINARNGCKSEMEVDSLGSESEMLFISLFRAGGNKGPNQVSRRRLGVRPAPGRTSLGGGHSQHTHLVRRIKSTSRTLPMMMRADFSAGHGQLGAANGRD